MTQLQSLITERPDCVGQLPLRLLVGLQLLFIGNEISDPHEFWDITERALTPGRVQS